MCMHVWNMNILDIFVLIKIYIVGPTLAIATFSHMKIKIVFKILHLEFQTVSTQCC